MFRTHSRRGKLLDGLLHALPACAVTLLLFLVCNAVWGIFPCGGKTVVWCDMEQQTVPLLLQLRQIAQRGESIAYTALDAGGSRFYGVFFFFLSNPFSLLIFLTDIPADRLVTLLVIIKLALASGTGAYWFRFRVRELPSSAAVLLGIMYGCSGYGFFYYQNLMWLDIMVMFPLLMCALRLLQKKGKMLPYLITLSLTMLLCFYICYMVVLYVLIDMVAAMRYSIPAKRRGKIAARFWGASLLAAALTAFVWLPCLIQVMQSARSGSLIESLMQSELFYHLGDKITLLGCTAIGFSMLPMLLQNGASRRDKMLFLLLTAALLLDPVNIMWHTGSYQAFPLRWGMIPILLMLTLAGKQLSDRAREEKPAYKSRSFSLMALTVSLVSVPAVILLIRKLAGDMLYSYVNSLWVSTPNAIFLIVCLGITATAYALTISAFQTRLIPRKVATLLLSGLFLCEFLTNYDTMFGAAANTDTLLSQTLSAADSIQPDDPTARIALTKKYAHANMVGALGYPTTAHYTSLTRADYLSGMKRLGYSSYWMEISSVGGTLLSDAVWNVRYLLGVRSDFPTWTNNVWSDGMLSIAESTLSVPTALYSDDEPEKLAALPAGSRITVQRMLAQQLGCPEDTVAGFEPTTLYNVNLKSEPGGETVCTLINPEEEGEIRFSLFIPDRRALYFDLYSQTGTELYTDRDGAVTVQYNGRTKAEEYPQNNRNGFVFLGEADQEYAVVRIKVHHDFSCESFGVFGINPDKAAEAFQQAEGTSLDYKNGVYTAQCETDHPCTLVLSAAYDEGFTAKVNGRPAEVYQIGGSRMAVKIPEGKSAVELKFRLQGLLPGILIGVIGLLAAAALLLLQKRIPLRLRLAVRRFSETAVRLAGIAIALVIYAMPVVLCLFKTIFNL